MTAMSGSSKQARWISVAKAADLVAETPKVIALENVRVALIKTEGGENTPHLGIYCIEDVCTHDEGPMAEGPVEGEVIECPRHGAKFNIKTGAVLSMPAITPIRTFPVRVIDSKVEIDVSSI